MATFSWSPDYGAAREINSNINTVKFGNSYEQRVLRGINNQPATWKVTFTKSSADINAIDQFLRATNGVTSFTFNAPDGTTMQAVVVIPYTRTVVDYGWEQISASFRQVYEPAS